MTAFGYRPASCANCFQRFADMVNRGNIRCRVEWTAHRVARISLEPESAPREHGRVTPYHQRHRAKLNLYRQAGMEQKPLGWDPGEISIRKHKVRRARVRMAHARR